MLHEKQPFEISRGLRSEIWQAAVAKGSEEALLQFQEGLYICQCRVSKEARN
jgi:hypothetical protein